MAGWIKLHRSLASWEWYDDINVTRLFVHCLIKANFEDRRHKGVLVPRGTFLTGRDQLARETGLSVRSIRTALTKLKSTNELAIKSTNQGTAVTVVKYNDFQIDDSKATSRSTSELTGARPANDQQTTTSKNIRNKEGEEIPPKSPKGEVSEGKSSVAKSNPTPIRPTQQELIAHLLEKMPMVNPAWELEQINRAAALLYDTWVSNNWRDGNGKPIKVWKTKAINTLKHHKPWSYGPATQPGSTENCSPAPQIL